MKVTPMQIRMQSNKQRSDIDKYYHKIKSEHNKTKGDIILYALKYYYEEVFLNKRSRDG